MLGVSVRQSEIIQSAILTYKSVNICAGLLFDKSIKKKSKIMTLLKLKQASGNQAFPAFENIFDLFDNSIHAGFRKWVNPAANILSTKNGYEVQLAAPGLKKDDFKVNVDGDQLTISSEVKEENTENTEKYSHREFRFSSFKRSFTLPENVNSEQISATYENGVLRLMLPVVENQKSKVKEIAVS